MVTVRGTFGSHNMIEPQSKVVAPHLNDFQRRFYGQDTSYIYVWQWRRIYQHFQQYSPGPGCSKQLSLSSSLTGQLG